MPRTLKTDKFFFQKSTRKGYMIVGVNHLYKGPVPTLQDLSDFLKEKDVELSVVGLTVGFILTVPKN